MLTTEVKWGRDLEKGLVVSSKGYLRLYVRPGTHVDREGNTMDMIALANALYFGTSESPPRPYFEDFLEDMEEELEELIKSSLVWRFQGVKGEFQYAQVARQVDLLFNEWVKDSGYYEQNMPNTEYTIDKKGSETPLIDTGNFLESVSCEYVYTR
jgi:hypothetical protein